MTATEKLLAILNWYAALNEEVRNELAKQENLHTISDIEVLIGASFPQELLELYKKNKSS